MVTYEDISVMFLNAVEETDLSAHPEFWLNTQTLEREFACTLHAGPCAEAERRATCTLSFAWAPLDTVLSYDGAEGICEFFHEPDDECPHLHTENFLPLMLDLSYSLPLEQVHLSEMNLRTLARTLKLRASEHSSRAVETRSTISLSLGESQLETEALILQQRVELPLWDPDGFSGYHHHGGGRLEGHLGAHPRRRGSREGDQPRPEDWLPHLLAEVAQDIARVLDAMEATGLRGYITGAHDSTSDN